MEHLFIGLAEHMGYCFCVRAGIRDPVHMSIVLRLCMQYVLEKHRSEHDPLTPAYDEATRRFAVFYAVTRDYEEVLSSEPSHDPLSENVCQA